MDSLFINHVFGIEGKPFKPNVLPEADSPDGVCKIDEAMYEERPMTAAEGLQKLLDNARGTAPMAKSSTFQKTASLRKEFHDRAVASGLEVKGWLKAFLVGTEAEARAAIRAAAALQS